MNVNSYNVALLHKEALQAQQPPFNNDLFNRFIEYTDVKETTIKGYNVCLRKFIKYLYDNNIHQPKREDIRAYKEYINKQSFTAGTKAQYLRTVKHFFKWTSSEGLYPNIADNIKGVKVKQDNTKKEAFNEADIKTILNSIDTASEKGKRNYAIILLAVTCGLRIIEMQRANIEDIQTIKGQKVLYIQGKGHDSKDDYKKLIPAVAEAIENYLQIRQPYKKNSPLFAGAGNRSRGERLTIPSISRTIKEVFINAGYNSKKLTAHSLRHTSNTLLFKSGADLYQVQKHARHQDPKTTEIYLHILDKENDTSEQEIYNQIYKEEKESNLTKVNKAIQDLNEEQQRLLFEYLKKKQ